MPTRKGKTTEARTDGLVNVISGMGVAGRDKTVANRFSAPGVLTQNELEWIYRGGGIGRRIVDLPIREMTREWFEVEGDSGNLIPGYLEALKAKLSIIDTMTWADLYGGALLVLGLDDGGELENAVAEEKLQRILFMHVYDRWQVTWTTGDLYTDPAHPKFGQPMRYRVMPYQGGGQFVVHETRTLRFTGAKIPPRVEREQHGWSDSVLQAPYEAIRNFVAGHAHSASLIEEWAIGVVTLKNLIQLLAAKDGEAKVRKRMEILDYGKAILRTMLLAEGETFEKKTQSVAGLSDVLDRLAQRVSAETGIPVTLLMGVAPAGLQATGEASRSNWFDDVRGRQEAKLQPQLETLVRYVQLAKQGPTKGREIPNWKIRFRSLWQPTDKETAELRGLVATSDAAYISSGVLLPEEVAVSRFGGQRWSMETVIAEGLRKRPEAKRPNGEDRDALDG